MAGKAVFLDRDGTIARNAHYCCREEDFEILPTVPQAIRLLNQHGFKVIVVTNQSAIARGYLTEEKLFQIHQYMEDELAKCGAHIDAIYYCPHHPDDGCQCRKPKPALLFRAAKKLGIDLSRSYAIGDGEIDIQAGRAASCRTVRVTTGSDVEKEVAESSDYIADTLLAAAEWIVKDAGLE